MAGQVLLNISRDEKERARLTSEYKYAVDLQSKVVEARRDIARKMLKRNRPIGEIVEDTGLSSEEVESLQA